MRRAVLASLVVAGLLSPARRAAAYAVAEPEPAPVVAVIERPFWDWLLAPHAEEIQTVLAKVREQRAAVQNAYPAVDPSTGLWSPSNAESRARLWADLEAMLRYAARLEPGDLEVRRELALVLGDAEAPTAEAALIDYLATELPDRPTGDARLRLALILARRGEHDAATAQLRVALAGGFLDTRGRNQCVMVLAQIYMTDGRLVEAIDLLESAIGPMALGYYYGTDLLQLQFSLAVAYDRDEQVSRAHEAIDKIAVTGPEQLGNLLLDPSGGRIPFVAPTDRTYFAALQLEAIGHLHEARTEWSAYARVAGARYAPRARAHAHALLGVIDQRAAEARKARAAARGPHLAPIVPNLQHVSPP